MLNIEQNLASVEQRILSACKQYKRSRKEITLIGASKTKSAELIRNFFDAGLFHFGENYLSEALDKQDELGDLPIHWHYIGQIQSNKTRLIANHFDWVHSVDRLKIAQRLNNQCERSERLNILIQINLDNEKTKAGVTPDNAIELCQQIHSLEKLQLRGLMAIPQARQNFQAQFDCLFQLKELQQEINHKLNLSLDTISAGMSNDLDAAIAAGSTMIRVGTDLFGKRT